MAAAAPMPSSLEAGKVDAAFPVQLQTHCMSDEGGVPAEVIASCADLFSSSYAVWSSLPSNADKLAAAAFRGKPGQHVKMSSKALSGSMLFDKSCGVVIARAGQSAVPLSLPLPVAAAL